MKADEARPCLTSLWCRPARIYETLYSWVDLGFPSLTVHCVMVLCAHKQWIKYRICGFEGAVEIKSS